ncbi:MAG: hypothetical protein HYT71_01170 [Candidatus Aenigmarchaeota archaeon]|nr:hypothetical protein [Candidatus Aenigmarchaeota archaeon]
MSKSYRKGDTSVIATIMFLLGAITLIGFASGWFNSTLGRLFNGGLYPQVEDFCANSCVIDSDKVTLVLVPLDANTIVQAKIINNAPIAKTYKITYYPNFTPELSLVAASPTIFVPPSGSALAEITVKGLIVRSNEINFNITAININNDEDNMSFGIRSVVNTQNVPDMGAFWMSFILLASAIAVYLKSG